MITSEYNDLPILADGWGDIATFIVIALFYLAGAIAKALSNRTKSHNQPAVQPTTGLSSPKRDRAKQISDWDRRQALKKSQKTEVAAKIRPARSISKPKGPILQPPSKEILIGRIMSSMGGQTRPFLNQPQMVQPSADTSQKQPAYQKQIMHEGKKKSIRPEIMRSPLLGICQGIGTPENLRISIALKEILDKPLAIRDSY